MAKLDLSKHTKTVASKTNTVVTSVNIFEYQRDFLHAKKLSLSSLVRDLIDQIIADTKKEGK